MMTEKEEEEKSILLAVKSKFTVSVCVQAREF